MNKIESVREIRGHVITIGNESYTRYSSICWYVSMGESDEPVYFCKDLEAAFQEWLKQEALTEEE